MQNGTFTQRRGFSVSPRGRLEYGGCDTVALAQKYGTPLYVVNEDSIRANIREYKRALGSYYPNWSIAYAGKAFLPMWMCDVVNDEELFLDVASGGELYTALKANFPSERIVFHGSNKSYDEIKMGLKANVGRFVVDNWLELNTLTSLAKSMGKRPDVLIRVAPGVEAHTHAYIETGQLDCKFGFGLNSGAAFQAIKAVIESESLNLRGLHCHIGSQITALDGPVLATKHMVEFMIQLKKQLNYQTEELNLGGGLGIIYNENEIPPSIDSYIKQLALTVLDMIKTENGDLELPRLYVEPGRSIVGNAGITLYTAGAIKDIPGIRKYVSLDGGMSDNPRPALYEAIYKAVAANRITDDLTETVCLAGKCCESDVLIHKAYLPKVLPGDIVAILDTGAYCYSMASVYNMLPRPAVVALSKGRAKLIVRRQSYEDLLAWDMPSSRSYGAIPCFSHEAASGSGESG